MKTVFEILCVAGFIQGFIIGVLLIFHRVFRKPIFILLGSMVLLMSLECLCNNEKVLAGLPWLYWLNNGNLFLLGPVFYFFVGAVKKDLFPSRSLFLIHAIPFIIIKSGTIILGPTGWGALLLPPIFFLVLNHLLSLHGTLYAVISITKAIKISKELKSEMANWAFWLSVVFVFGWFVSFAGRQFEAFNLPLSFLSWTLAYFTLIILIYIISVKLILIKSKGEVVVNHNDEVLDNSTQKLPKYHKSELKSEECIRLTKILDQTLNEKKLYLDPDLNRTKLAESVNITAHSLSQLLNNHLNKSFYEYINEYRLKEVCIRMVDPIYANYTILGIAFESGFASKSSFQRFFKKNLGQTPTEYLEKIKKNK